MNSRMAIFLLKIDHLTEDFVVCLASGKFVLDISPQSSIIWLWMTLIGDCMVFHDQDHGFHGQNPLDGVDVGLERHDPGPRIPLKHL